MDDVIAFVIDLLNNSAALKALFPGGKVVCAAPGENVAAVYPSIVVTSSDGRAFPQGEPGEKIKNATLTISVYDRDTDTVFATDPNWEKSQLVNRLIVGDPAYGVPSIKNSRVTNSNGVKSWIILNIFSTDPSGPRDHADPKVKNNVLSFSVQILRM